MHSLARACKASSRANHKRLRAIGRYEDRKCFHRKNVVANVTSAQRSPRNEEATKRKTSAALQEYEETGDSIVITGISGRFPNTDGMAELKENLNTGVDMVAGHSRWQSFNPFIPLRMGEMKNMDKLDSEFFGVNSMVADAMDPQQRRLLEVGFEAIFDAGINPTTLRGSKTGVYVGTTGGETAEYWLCKGAVDELEGYRLLGCVNYVQANRLSFTLDLQGPCMTLNTGCSASFVALECAIHAIREGTCDQAIVAGTTVHLSPFTTAEIAKLGALSHEGYSRVFDDDAKGYARAEAVVAMLVQRKRDAKRHYATIRGVLSCCEGFKREGITFPSAQRQEDLLRRTYSLAGVDPADVTYFEAHGTGTPAGDPQELTSISKVVAKAENRKQPLLVGSVKSNLGHTESAAGLTSIAKVLLSLEQGFLPANLHFKKPNSLIKDLFDDSLQIVDKHTPWEGGLVSISSFGIGGTIAHTILEPGPKINVANKKVQQVIQEKKLPILIPFAGRTKELTEASITESCNVENIAEGAGLLHEVFQHNIPGYDYRGYGLIVPGQEQPVIEVEKCSNSSPPVWLIFPGMGSQWNEMGNDLMKIDAFSESIQRSQATLKNKGIDLQQLLKPNNPSIFENIRDSIVAITAVQIALYDTLMSMGLNPEGFIGHSSGEILCAYADGCFSAEETLLVGEARGRAFHESRESSGGMASIGLTWEEAKSRCPPGVYPACHNGADNVSVAGSAEEVKKFADQLQAEGVFARQVNTCGFAPHTKYVFKAHDLLVKYMSEIYSDDRPRSSKWISSSIPEANWGSKLSLTSSPAYHANNLTSPVLFHEAVQKVPENAAVIEIAPRGLFQPILRESLHKDCKLFSPMHHSVEDKLSFFLSSVGKMYNAGLNINMGKLYPPIQFPVSSTAPMTSSLVKWVHDRVYRVHCLSNPHEFLGTTYKIDLGERQFSFLQGHKLDTRCLFPATGYIVQAWQGHAAANGQFYKDFPATFEDVSFERATFLKEDKAVELKYAFFKGTNKFVIEEEGVTVIRGSVVPPADAEKRLFQLPLTEIPEHTKRMSLNSDDIYKEFRLRGYNYSGEFRGIERIDNEGKWAQVAWRGNWISFLDTIVQTMVLSFLTRSTAVPIRFKSITIDPIKFYDYVKEQEALDGTTEYEYAKRPDPLIPVSINASMGIIQCPGIELRGLTAVVIPRPRQKEMLSLEEYNFTPYFDDKGVGKSPSVYTNTAELVDLVIENITPVKLKIVDIFGNAENSFTETIASVINLKKNHKAETTMLSTAAELDKIEDRIKNLANSVSSKDSVENLVPDSGFVDLVFLDQPHLLTQLAEVLQDNAHVILRNSDAQSESISFPESLLKISEKFSDDTSLTLFRKLSSDPANIPVIQSAICVDDVNYDWLPKLQEAMELSASDTASSNSRIYLYSQNDPHNGIVGLTKCLMKEPGGERVRCIFDPEGKLPIDFENPGGALKQLIEQDLVMNVLKKGKLGSFRHLPMSRDAGIPSKEVEHAYVNTLTTGDLTSLRWIESPLAYFDPIKDKARGEVCTVSYAALNFRDIMLATGKLPIDSRTNYDPQDCVFGFEFSGVNSKGERIMGMMASKAMASSVLIEPGFMTWKVPDQWTLAEAATIPVVYSTAYYALCNRARIKPKQSILIHSGTGGVGQAAINIALSLDCEVFTTVGTDEKRKYLKELYPALKEENIGNSRDCSFEKMIMERTNCRGVDIVLNSLADEKLQASIRCVAVHGKFLEIGAFDAFQNSNLGMECFLKNIELHGIFLNHFLGGTQAEKDALGNNLLVGIETGVVKPLPRTVFEKDEIEEAFRFMAGGKHMGKVLIEVQKEENIAEKPKVMAIPRSYFSPDKSYVVIGGLGGMGLEVANWLVDRGARHLVLTSRSGVISGYQELCLRKWEEQGVKVETSVIDLSDYNVAEKLIQDLTANGKQIGGIFNSGLVLQDGLLDCQTQEMFAEVAAPKIVITKNLDKLTRQYCKEGLDYFVCFSSMSCGRGNAEQTNYGMANSAMERLCESRKEDGLHGLAIQWGIIGEVGAVAEKIFGAKLTGEEIFDGALAQRISSCLDVLDMTLHQNATTFSSIVLAEDDGKKSKKVSLLESISHICGVKDMSTIKPTTKLIDLGMDSIIGMEVKQLIERDYDTPLTVNELRTMTFNDLLMIEAGTYVKGQSLAQLDSSSFNDLLEILKGGQDTLVKLKYAVDGGDDNSNLFIIHGVDGHSSLFLPLAEHLECEVFGFQFVEKLEGQPTIESLAREYIEELKEVQPEGPYTIASFSAGTSIAFEMALLLENEFGDQVDNLIVLDGCCCWKKFSERDEKSLGVDGLIETIKSSVEMSATEEKKMKEALSLEDHDANIKVVVEMMKSKVPNIDTVLVSKYFDRATAMSNLLAEYEPNRKVRAKVTLLKAKQKALWMAGITDECYNLQQYCLEPVTVFDVDGDHMSLLRRDKCSESANIINDILLSSEEDSDEEPVLSQYSQEY